MYNLQTCVNKSVPLWGKHELEKQTKNKTAYIAQDKRF